MEIFTEQKLFNFFSLQTKEVLNKSKYINFKIIKENKEYMISKIDMNKFKIEKITKTDKVIKSDKKGVVETPKKTSKEKIEPIDDIKKKEEPKKEEVEGMYNNIEAQENRMLKKLMILESIEKMTNLDLSFIKEKIKAPAVEIGNGKAYVGANKKEMDIDKWIKTLDEKDKEDLILAIHRKVGIGNLTHGAITNPKDKANWDTIISTFAKEYLDKMDDKQLDIIFKDNGLPEINMDKKDAKSESKKYKKETVLKELKRLKDGQKYKLLEDVLAINKDFVDYFVKGADAYFGNKTFKDIINANIIKSEGIKSGTIIVWNDEENAFIVGETDQRILLSGDNLTFKMEETEEEGSAFEGNLEGEETTTEEEPKEETNEGPEENSENSEESFFG